MRSCFSYTIVRSILSTIVLLKLNRLQKWSKCEQLLKQYELSAYRQVLLISPKLTAQVVVDEGYRERN